MKVNSFPLESVPYAKRSVVRGNASKSSCVQVGHGCHTEFLQTAEPKQNYITYIHIYSSIYACTHEIYV